jgi:hypothetical protein
MEADYFDQVFCFQPVAAVADVVAVHAAGIGQALLPAIRALHLLWLIEVFEVTAADEAAGRGRSHVVGVLWGARIKISADSGRR